MSFTVQKSLLNSTFRFSVGRRRDLGSIEPTTELSTGPAGEFIRHRPEIFYSADVRAIRSPALPPARSATSVPFWTSIMDGTIRGYLMMFFMGLGALLILLGMAVLTNKGSQGWIVVILGFILALGPILLTGQKRRAARLREESSRKEREEREAHNAELLGVYTGALERLRENPNDESLALVHREHEKLDLPYAVWADTAIGTVLHVGFSTLARVGPERASEVAALMDRSSTAAGLIREDAAGVKNALYSTILWHLIADDRLGSTQLQLVRSIQTGFAIRNEDVPIDASSEEQFDRLRGIDHRNAPRCEVNIPLGMNEYCLYTADVESASGQQEKVYVTNKRVVVEGRSKAEIPVPSVDDLSVDADQRRIHVKAAGLKKAFDFRVPEPIYLAAMIDLANRLDDRPRSFM